METDNLSDTNLNTVKESILDEEKLVTYVSLSKDLCIHVNDCKLLLHRAIENIRKEKPNLQLKISYIISGISEDNKRRLTVCPEAELDQVRNTFKTTFFEHVYSVCKGVGSINNNSMLLLHKLEDFVLSKGHIKNYECSKHSSDDLNALKEKILDYKVIKETEPAVAVITKIKKENNPAIIEKTDLKWNKEDKNSNIQLKTETVVKSESDLKSKQVNGNQNPQKNANSKNQKGIAGFFTKSVASNKKSAQMTANGTLNINGTARIANTDFEEIDVDEKKIDKATKEIKVEKDTEKSKKVIEKLKKETEAVTTLETNGEFKTTNKDEKNKKLTSRNSTELNKNSKSSQIKKPTKVDKNRKRVLQVSDSDSEEENDPFLNKQNILDHSDDEIPPTPMANNIKITSGLVNPKKKRKIVDKTYISEDGFILTKKEEVYESCSDNEEKEGMKATLEKNSREESIKEENIIKNVTQVKKEKDVSPIKNAKKQSKKHISPPKGKQATMTSFFKRK